MGGPGGGLSRIWRGLFCLSAASTSIFSLLIGIELLDHFANTRPKTFGRLAHYGNYPSHLLATCGLLHVVRLGMATQAKHRTQVYNLGAAEYMQVNDSIRFICGALGLTPELRYTGGDRGWIGDNPFIFLDT